MQTYPSTTAPAAYDPDAEVDRLYSAITGRQRFSYTPSADPMYRSYADRYVQNGRLAMRDTVGTAAALTGGYGSTYAQSAGQQQYDEYLRSLSEVLPELYGLAYQQYSDQGAALQDAYGLAYQRRESDYQRGRDALADQRYEQEAALQAEATRYKQLQDSYTKLVKLISSAGYSPTDAELEAAGLSRAQAEALRNEYLRQNGLNQPAPARTEYYAVTPAASSGGKSSKGTPATAATKTSKGAALTSASGAAVAAGLKASKRG